MRWILDDRQLDQLAGIHEKELLQDLPPGRLLVARTTADDANHRRKRFLDLRLEDETLVEVFGVPYGSEDPAHQILLELQGEVGMTDNLAERESIAWALTHGRDSVFVTLDQRAALTALAELGRGRVAHPFDLWLDLLERQVVDRGGFEMLCEWTKTSDQGLERMPGRIRSLLPTGTALEP